MVLPAQRRGYFRSSAFEQEAKARSHQAEQDYRNAWAQNSKYFNEATEQARKTAHWLSEKSFNKSLTAGQKRQLKEERTVHLEERRTALKVLLGNEAQMFMSELKVSPRDAPISTDRYRLTSARRLEDMRERSDGLRSARLRREEELARQKYHEQFRLNSPEIRKLESEQHQQHVIDSWSQQQREKIEQEERAQKIEAKEHEERMHLMKEKDKQLEEEEALRKERNIEVADYLSQQIQEIKQREEESAFLNRQYEEALREQWELEKLEEEHRALQKEREKSENARILIHQYRNQMRKRFADQRDELMADMEVIQALQEQTRKEKESLQSERDRLRADMDNAIEEARLRFEEDHAFEMQLDSMYRDEAERMWRRREKEWEIENERRRKLTEEVMAHRGVQISEKLRRIQQQQQESLRAREDALQDLAALQLEEEAEKKRETERQIDRKTELEAQITARKEALEISKAALEKEIEERNAADARYAEMVAMEKEQITARGFQPKTHGRKALNNIWDEHSENQFQRNSDPKHFEIRNNLW